MTTIGNLFMALAFLGALLAVGALFWGRAQGEREGESLTNAGYIATFGVFGLLSLAVLVLLVGFFTENFTFQYVVQNHPTDVSRLAWLYKISGVWAGREGSLLFWSWLLSTFAAFMAYKRMEITDPTSNMGLAVTNAIQTFFLASLFIQNNNPFKTSPAEWLGPNGELLIGGQGTAMNPLLQHWAMILHPPTLFIGYAGLAIPFAFAIGALIVNDPSKKWVEIVDRVTVFAWLFLGIGIGLGAIWAYVVLGWGGYWAWDPVENASLLPWLTGVGLLHSFTVYRRRDGFKGWAVILSAVTFTLVILGTFITRSGMVQSVHAFEEDPLSFWLFLTMMVGTMAAAAIGMAIRRKEFAAADEFQSLTSKEAAYYFNNVLMLIAAVIVAYLTVTSALPRWMPGGGLSFGPSTYDAIARPVGILYVAIMAICPVLVWRKTEGSTFWKRIKWPLVGAVVVSALLLVEWWVNLWPIHLRTNAGANPVTTLAQGWYAVIGLVVAAFAVSVPTYLFIDGARKRSAAKGEGFFGALLNIITKARTQSGGYLTHLGIGIILIGLVGSTMFVDDVKASVEEEQGAKFEAGGYTFTYLGFNQEDLPNGDVNSVVAFDVSKDGKAIGTVTPAQVQYAAQEQTRLNVDVIVQPLRDVFVIFEGADDNGIAMNVKINPLISWAWAGFILTIIGTTIAVWPKRRRAAA